VSDTQSCCGYREVPGVSERREKGGETPEESYERNKKDKRDTHTRIKCIKISSSSLHKRWGLKDAGHTLILKSCGTYLDRLGAWARCVPPPYSC